MKVKELIEQLQQTDPEREVIMQKDVEGNGYSPYCEFWEGAYKAETTWYGEAGLEELDQAARDAGYSEEDVIGDGVRAIFLRPIN